MFKRKWSVKEQIHFLEKLGQLLQKGYTLSNAIELLRFQQTAVRREQLAQCLEVLRQGNSLHDALLKLKFPEEVLSYLFLAEKHGDLSFALLKGSQMLSQKRKFQEKLQKVLRYPMFLIGFIFLLLVFLQQVLLPQFISLYSSMDIELSLFIQLMSELPQFISLFLIIAFSITIVWYLIYYQIIRKRLTKSSQMNLLLKIPLLRNFFLLKNTQYFSSQLSTLLSGGLPILEALSVFKEQDHMGLFKEEAVKITEMLTKGEHLEQILSKRPFYEKDLSLVVSHGQSNGSLALELADYSELLMDRIEEDMYRFTAILQPFVFLIVGSFVVALYLSIMYPLFQMMEVL